MFTDESIPNKQLSALLSPEFIDRLADVIISKLSEKNTGNLLPKQKVASSNLVSRSSLTYPSPYH